MIPALVTHLLFDSTRADFVKWVNERCQFSYESTNALGSTASWSTSITKDESGFRFRTHHQSAGSRERTSGYVAWKNLLGASTIVSRPFATLHLHLVKPIVTEDQSWNGSMTTLRRTVLDLAIPFPTLKTAQHAAILIDQLEESPLCCWE